MKSTDSRKARRPYNDDDSQPVMVPRNDKGLVAMPPERVQRLREHLIKELADLRKAKHLECFASPVHPPHQLALLLAWHRPRARFARASAAGTATMTPSWMIGPWRASVSPDRA